VNWVRKYAFELAFACTLVAVVSCAQFKQVLKTIDDVANVACEIFGTNHPQEFAQLVSQVKPALTPQLEREAINVKALCDIKEVVQPFIDDQLQLQNRTAMQLRASMHGSGGGEQGLTDGGADAAATQ
jgi:hypothetical protein